MRVADINQKTLPSDQTVLIADVGIAAMLLKRFNKKQIERMKKLRGM